MSKEAVRLFIKDIEQDESLQDLVREWYENPNVNVNLHELGRERGFEFTAQEVFEVWEEIENESELPDLGSNVSTTPV